MNILFDPDNKHLDLEVTKFDHSEAEKGDCGLPENPIFSDYSKYLWKGHIRSGGIQKNKKIRKTQN